MSVRNILDKLSSDSVDIEQTTDINFNFTGPAPYITADARCYRKGRYVIILVFQFSVPGHNSS